MAVAAPVGAIGVLCIRRTLAQGRMAGLATGLGAATADALYGCLAAAGWTSLFSLVDAWEDTIRALGGIALIALGVRMARTSPSPDATATASRSLIGYWAGTTILTLTNPSTIFMFLALFAGTDDGAGLGSVQAMAVLVAGVFVGSAAWWLGLTWALDRGRGRLPERARQRIGIGAGAVIAGFGMVALISLVTG